MLALALLAVALSPQEAADLSAVVGRPLPAMVVLSTEPRSISFAPGGPALPIFLNRNGGSYSCGDDDSAHNLSSIVCGGGGDVGGFPGTDAQWQQVVGCVREEFSPFNLAVTDQEPASGQYIEAVVGGSPGQAGMPSGVAGVSPFFCGVIPTSIVYTFADVYQGSPTFVRDVCETTAQEVAHSFGLDHELLCEDPMTYLTGCGDKSFHDQAVTCGEFQARQCSCGNATQNSVQQMLDVLGPSAADTAPPTVSLAAPADGAVLAANGDIVVEADADDDAGAPDVALEWDFSADEFGCPGSDGAWSCTRDGTHYTWRINVGVGARTFRVRARDIGGNEVTTEDRTIWLSTDGSGPPHDDGAPTILVAAPVDGVVRPANQTLFISATVVDDAGVQDVVLDWPHLNQTFACPFNGDNVSCTVDGSTYTWALEVGSGDRTWSIFASDAVGNRAVSGPYSLTLVAGAAVPVDDLREDDDTFDTAKPLSCGASLDLVGDDADWSALDVPSGTVATVTTAPALPLTARRGPLDADVVAGGDGSLEVGADAGGGAQFFLGVLPSTEAGPYHLEVACEDAPPPAGGDGGGGGGGDGGGDGGGGGSGAAPQATPIVHVDGGSCAAAGGSSTVAALALLAALALPRRRRRRSPVAVSS